MQARIADTEKKNKLLVEQNNKQTRIVDDLTHKIEKLIHAE